MIFDLLANYKHVTAICIFSVFLKSMQLIYLEKKMHRKRVKEKPVSVLQGDEKFLNKILSRNSSVGRSMRVSSYGSSGQVPFEWEMKPGMPRDPSTREIMSDDDDDDDDDDETDPPIFQPPPPVVQLQSSLDRTKQGILISLPKIGAGFWRKMIWKKIKKKIKKKKKVHQDSVDHDQGGDCGHVFSNSEFSNSDIADFRASVSDSSSSTTSSALSSLHSSHGHGNVQTSILKSFAGRFVKHFTAKSL
ncbi:hypothetical protein Ddye_021472 [Dipteronia dyeriana]|uniref:Uncharacterized protein n=1 Tax=Dipteronia dyeriana TaxID=168575 RepID=A0AAD9WXR6_9ROSI|nr:hypothetical protein Ddye_021472 [Dipteronia dyeriana]